MGFFNMVFTTEEDGAPLLPWYQILLVYVQYIWCLFFSYVFEYADKLRGRKIFKPRKGYSPLFQDFDSLYTRRFFGLIRDCWDRPICSAPSAWVDVMERYTPDYNNSFIYTGKKKRCFNLASYNYLGFAGPESPTVADVKNTVKKYGVGTCSPRVDIGTSDLHTELETLTAEFVGKEACMIFGMGFATNSTNIPALIGKGDLVFSDSLNHASTVTGCRSSGAKIKVFRHNDAKDLERLIRESIVEGQPRTHRPWKKILIVVEGVYSMEGEIAKLVEIVKIKKKYKCYLYVDEAHSIGALGKTGRGVCEHWGVEPKDIDVLMGTFTKAFASVGGYVAADKDIIDTLKRQSYAHIYEPSMSAASVQQAISALKIIMGKDGSDLGQKKKYLHYVKTATFSDRL